MICSLCKERIAPADYPSSMLDMVQREHLDFDCPNADDPR